ncbi:TraB/GumN family protein [Flaviaesturariibacter amylovorans]|uniref:TraB/GumN family protein n=1 Tax=Flaviaesturariibacter amylovorans TaxID=1084520 RepID=A0ABP8G4I0_9BACT
MLRNLLALLLGVTCLSVQAQNTHLWKVTDPQSKHVSYLFGTYHLFGNTFVDSFPAIRSALEASIVVVTETSMDLVEQRRLYHARPSSPMLAESLSPADRDLLQAIINRRRNVDLSRLTPGELLVRLQAYYPLVKCPVISKRDTIFMDEYLQHLGRQAGKRMVYLETDSFQLVRVGQLTKHVDWPLFRKAAPAWLALYRKEGLEAVRCEMSERYAGFADEYKLDDDCRKQEALLIRDRNADWMTRLPALLRDAPTFVAVGRGHLERRCGLVAELRRLGFTVEPVPLR